MVSRGAPLGMFLSSEGFGGAATGTADPLRG
jgi:hypothetical protein